MDSKSLLKQLEVEIRYNKKLVEKVIEVAERILLENRALKEENDALKKYAAMLLGEYGYDTKDGLNCVMGAISNKEKIISDWNEIVAFEKEIGETLTSYPIVR